MRQRHITIQHRPNRTQQIIESNAREMSVNPPKILAHTAAKFGEKRAEEQRVAILLDKSRREGAKIRKKRSRKNY